MLSKRTIAQRGVIHSRDVENITGCKSRTAQNLLQTIRRVFDKEKFQYVTVNEFCLFTGIDEDTVRECMLD